jgi:NodT family efflux transporter outer membrane factor (OMF) lipoprotein
MKRIALAAVLLLAGCEVGPDYVKPDIATPSSYQDLPVTKPQAPFSVPIAGEADLSAWWMQFGDPELQSLIARALKSNLDLMTAASRVREARQQEVIAGAAGLPQVNANGLAAHIHSNTSLAEKLGTGGSPSSGGSSSAGSGSGGAPPSGPSDTRFYSLGFDATWELDIFGGVRRSVEAAQAGTEAAVWQMRDGEVSLTAEIATDYLTLRATQARIAILQTEAQAQQGVLQLTTARARTGFVTQLDVNQQIAQVESTRAQIPELQAQVRAMEHAIAVLLAEQPEAMTAELDTAAALPALPPQLPVGLPSDLLRRRPDVRAAERQLASATAQIGVQVANLYPKFNLLALAGFSGNEFTSLLSGKNLAEIGAGQISWPIFDAGKTHANIRTAKEEEKQAYYAYQKAILGAVRDVEDALVRYTSEQQKFVEIQRSLKSASSSLTLARSQYRAGTVTYVNVYNAQVSEQSARDQLAQSQQQLAIDLVSLYKALGGGWKGQKSTVAEN